MFRVISKKIKLSLLLIFFIIFNQNSTLLPMDKLGTDIIRKIFADYIDQNPDINVKDYLIFLAEKSQLGKEWQEATKEDCFYFNFNFILNFCKQNRLDITTLKLSQLFDFYQECLTNENYDWDELEDYQDKNYYLDFAPIPEELIKLINKKDLPIEKLLNSLSIIINLEKETNTRMRIKALKLNIENLCEVYKIKLKYESIFGGLRSTNKTLFDEYYYAISSLFTSDEIKIRDFTRENINKNMNKIFSILLIGLNPYEPFDGDDQHKTYSLLKEHRPEFCKLLLKLGANPDIKNKKGITLLQNLVDLKCDKDVLILLENGADPSYINQEREKKASDLIKATTCTIM